MGTYGGAVNLHTVLDSLLDCVEDELAACGLPGVDERFVAPGEEVPWLTSCSMLYARVSSWWPTENVPQQVVTLRNCKYEVSAQFSVGILRCQTGVDRDMGPTPDELTGDGKLMIDDQAAIWRALTCGCVSEQLVLWQATPLGPQGGLYGVEWAASVLSDQRCQVTSP